MKGFSKVLLVLVIAAIVAQSCEGFKAKKQGNKKTQDVKSRAKRNSQLSFAEQSSAKAKSLREHPRPFKSSKVVKEKPFEEEVILRQGSAYAPEGKQAWKNHRGGRGRTSKKQCGAVEESFSCGYEEKVLESDKGIETGNKNKKAGKGKVSEEELMDVGLEWRKETGRSGRAVFQKKEAEEGGSIKRRGKRYFLVPETEAGEMGLGRQWGMVTEWGAEEEQMAARGEEEEVEAEAGVEKRREREGPQGLALPLPLAQEEEGAEPEEEEEEDFF